MSGKLKLLAGDWETVYPNHTYTKGWGGSGTFSLLPKDAGFKLFASQTISSEDLVYLQLANEETVKTVGGTVGWGAVGATLLGPVGLLAGLLMGGKKTQVTFVAKFKDGRKLIATTDPTTWVNIQAGALHLL